MAGGPNNGAMNRIRGHEEGAESVRTIVRATRELGIPWLTLYAFSEENWRRPRYEVEALMVLLKRFLKSELREMLDNGIRFQAIGRLHKLPKDVQKTLRETAERTASQPEYGSDPCPELRRQAGDNGRGSERWSKEWKPERCVPRTSARPLFRNILYTANMPDPDLLIRTSGECRVSNFLLWQIAYAEIYMTPT